MEHEGIDSEKYAEYDGLEQEIIHPEVIKMLGNINNKRIADNGCGEGRLLLDLVQRGAIGQGFDISKGMIRKAKKNLGSKVSLEVIQSGKIPVESQSLDAVVSKFVLMMCSFDDIKNIFREVERVLKTGGKWIYAITHPAFSDRDFNTYRNIFPNGRNYFEKGQPYQFVLKSKNGKEVTDSSFIDHHYSLSSYLNLLPENGFNFEEMMEVQVPGNELPPYLIVKGSKK